MSLIGTYRKEGITAASGASSDRIYNFSGFKPSGLEDGNILGIALYVWSGASNDGYWTPMKVGWF